MLFNFTLEEIKYSNNKSGIYGLFYDNKCFYIGQSINIGRRLREHRNEKAVEHLLNKIKKENYTHNREKQLQMYKFINKNREHIKYSILIEAPKDNLNELEKKYIIKYKPIFNYEGIDIIYQGVNKF